PAHLMTQLDASHPGVPTLAAVPDRLSGVTLVDLPAAVDAGEVARLADLVLVVVSPARYADAAVWDAIDSFTAASVPWWVVTNRMAGELEDDMKRRLAAADTPLFPLGGRHGDGAAGV